MQPLASVALRKGYELFLVVTIFCSYVPACRGASLTWDFNGTALPSPGDGSGNWLASGNWWNGSTNVNGNWTATAPDNASFGAGTPGAYTVAIWAAAASTISKFDV